MYRNYTADKRKERVVRSDGTSVNTAHILVYAQLMKTYSCMYIMCTIAVKSLYYTDTCILRTYVCSICSIAWSLL